MGAYKAIPRSFKNDRRVSTFVIRDINGIRVLCISGHESRTIDSLNDRSLYSGLRYDNRLIYWRRNKYCIIYRVIRAIIIGATIIGATIIGATIIGATIIGATRP